MHPNDHKKHFLERTIIWYNLVLIVAKLETVYTLQIKLFQLVNTFNMPPFTVKFIICHYLKYYYLLVIIHEPNSLADLTDAHILK